MYVQLGDERRGMIPTRRSSIADTTGWSKGCGTGTKVSLENVMGCQPEKALRPDQVGPRRSLGGVWTSYESNHRKTLNLSFYIYFIQVYVADSQGCANVCCTAK